VKGGRGPAAREFGENPGPAIAGGIAMQELLVWVGRLAGVAGVALCAVAVVARLVGAYWLGGFQVGTLLQIGVAGMVLGCLCFLAALTERSRARP
jgi:hypothetical protein